MSKKLLLFIILFTALASTIGLAFAFSNKKNTIVKSNGNPFQNVLAAAIEAPHYVFKVNVPSFFNQNAQFNKDVDIEGILTLKHKTLFKSGIDLNNTDLDLGTGNLTAPNIIYSVKAGDGVKITTGQNPTISVITPTNTGVTALQGATGDVSLTNGSGITIDGLKISNEDPGSAQNIFKTITTGGTSFTAGANNDILTFTAGSGVTITPDSSNKSLTFSAASSALSGLTTNGVLYATSNSTTTSLTPGTPGFVLQSNGAGSPPSWVANSGTSPAFSIITSGTNTSAAMLVGTGASLNITGSGTINASSLLGNTWASPGTIGSTTANTGAFTTLTGTTFNGLAITNNGSNTLNLAANKTFIVNNSLTLNGTDGTVFSLPLASDTLIGRASTDTLTNKTIAAGTNTITGLTNSNLSGAAGISNANLANASLTVTAGTGLSGGGAVALGSSITLNNAGVLSLTSTQASVSASTGNITLSLPQNIDTSASPTFNGLVLASLGTGVAHVNSSGALSSAAVNLTNEVTGTLGAGNGGTGFSSYTIGDILYASGANTFTKLGIGSPNQVLSVNSGIPIWSTVSGSGGLCSDCVVTDPTTSAINTIAPATNGVVGLTLKETSVGSADIIRLQNAAGNTTYFKVDNNGNVILGNNNLTFGGGETASLTSGKNVSFADVFTTSGSNPLTLTTTGNTNVTLPTTGTLITNTAAANQTITSSQSNGTVLNLTDATNISLSPLTGMDITLSGTGTQDQTGLAFHLSGASGSNLNDIVGSGSTWKVSRTGDATFNSITTTSMVNAASITSSGTFLASNGSAVAPSYTFTNSTGTGLYLPSNNNFGIATGGVERLRVDNSGNVGIGTTTPLTLLQVSGATAGKALTILDYNGSGQNILVASSSGSTKFVLSNTGAITTGIWNGTAIDEAHGGTNQTSYLTGDILYASGSNTLAKLPIGSAGQALIISGGVPVWSNISGGSGCTDCVINDPTTGTVNTITPTAGSVTPLTLQAAPSGSNDLFDIKSNNGSSTYLAVNSSGAISIGIWNGTAIDETHGGTNQTSYTKGDILYASGANTLSKLNVGSLNQVLAVNGSGVPAWSTVAGGSGGLCSACLITNPTTSLTNTVAPATTGVVGLTLRETSVGSADIADIQNTAGSTTYLKIDQNGDLTSNDNLIFANGASSSLYKIDTNANARFALLNGNAITAATFNGNIISTGSGTLTLAAGKTLTANNSIALAGTDGKTATFNDNTTFNTNSLTLAGTESLTMTASKNVNFADAFTTSGSNPLTLTTTASTNVTLPTTGTLLTNTAAANQTITSSQTSGTVFALTDSTNIAAALVGQSITLSGTGAFDQTGLKFNLSGASGANLNDIIGTGSTWKISNAGAATFASLNSAGLLSANGGLTVASGQNLTLAAITGNNAILYATAATGIVTSATTSTANQCLLSGAGNAPAWGTCALGTNFWQLNSGVLSPATITNSLAIGQTTSLANAGLDVEVAGKGNSIAVFNQKDSGPILTASASGTPRFTILNDGSLDIGKGNVNTTCTNNTNCTGILLNGILRITDAYNAGYTNFRPQNGILNLYDGTNDEGLKIYASNGSDNLLLQQGTGTYATFHSTTPIVLQATGTGSSNTVSVGATSPLAKTGLQVGVNSLGNASFVVDNTGGQGDIFTASSAGTAKFVIDKNGNVGIANGVAGLVNGLRVGNAASSITPRFITVTDIDTSANGSAAYVGNWNNASSLWGIGAGTNSTTDNTLRIGNTANSTGSNSWATTQNFRLAINGTIGTSAQAALDLGAANGTLAVASISGKTSFASLVVDNSGLGDIFTASSSGLNRFVITQAGNVGVGTTTPTDKLDILAGTTHVITSNWGCGNGFAGIGFTTTTTGCNNFSLMGGDGSTYLNGPSSLFLEQGTAHRLTLINTGGVGINTDTPTAILDVRGIGNNTLSGTIPIASISGKTSFASLVVDNSGQGDLFTASSSGLNRFVITQAGNVGIGTTLPSQEFYQSGGKMVIDSTNSTYSQLQIGNSSSNQEASITFNSGATAYGTSPSSVNGNNNIWNMGAGVGGLGGNTFSIANNAGAERLVILSNGLVGIGNTNPLTALDVNGSASESGNLTFRGSGTAHQIDLLQNGTLGFYNSVGGDTGLGANPALYIGSGGHINAGGTITGNAIFQVTNPSGTYYALNLSRSDQSNSGINFQDNAGTLLIDNSAGTQHNLQLDQSGNLTLLGNITAATYAGANAILYAAPTTGLFTNATTTTVNQCLLSGNGVSGVPSWGACALGTNYWAQTTNNSNTVLNPGTLTNELAIGTDGTSANFVPFTALFVQPAINTKGNALVALNQTGSGPIFTASTSGSTKFVIANDGSVGIGNATPAYPLHISSAGSNFINGGIIGIDGNLTSTTNDQYALASIPIAAPGSASTHTYTGGLFQPSSNSNNLANGQLQGVHGDAYYNGTGTLGVAQGGYFQNQLQAAGTITNSYGVYIDNPSKSAGTITTNYGLYVVGQTAGTTNYAAIFAGGNVGIGTTAPIDTLDVRGNSGTTAVASVSGKTSFASMVIDNSGVGDIFTASSSGLNRFVINQNGNVGVGPSYIVDDGSGAGGANGINQISISNTTAGAFTKLALNGPASSGGTGIEFMQGGVSKGDFSFARTNNEMDFINRVGSSPLSFQTNTTALGGIGERLRIDGTGFIGIGVNSATPLATLDTRAESGTIAVASVSGKTSFAGMVVDNSGVGDLFTASSSGLPRFTITQNGNITDTTATSVNFAGAALNVSSCTGCGGTNFWQKDTNGISSGVYDSLITSAEGLTLGAHGTDANIVPFSTLYVAPSVNSKGNALVSVNQTGAGPIFTASQAGTAKFVIDNAGNVGVGTSTPLAYMNIAGNGSQDILFIDQYGGTTAPDLIGRTAHGTAANPTATAQDDRLLTLGGRGYGTSAFASLSNAAINFFAGQAFTNANQGAYMDFETTPLNSNIRVERMRLDPSGNLGINTTSPLAILDIRGTSGTNAMSGTIPVASVSGKTSFSSMVIDNSGVGDLFTASSSGKSRFTIQQNGVIQIGDSTNGLTFDYVNGGPSYAGTARPTKQIILSPEYAGAILSASGSATTNGQMISDASPAANFRTYYNWTSSQTTLQDYVIAIRVTLPKDFSGWTTNNALTVDMNTQLTPSNENKLDIFLYNPTFSTSTPVLYDQAQSSASQKTWKTIAYTSAMLSNWATAGQTATIYLKVYAKDNNYVQVGDIVLNYLAKF